MKPEWIRPLFVVAAAYDLVLGLLFLLTLALNLASERIVRRLRGRTV